MKLTYPIRAGNDLQLLVDGGAFFPAMLQAIEEAKESVVLAMYLVASGQCLDKWNEAIAAAARRDVQIRVLVDGFGGFFARTELGRLAGPNVQLVWFNPPRLWPPSINLFRDHRKLLVIDGETGFIGGFCLTDDFDPDCTDKPWHDIALRVRGPVVGDMLAEFERDWSLYAGGPSALSKPAPGTAGQADCRIVRNHPLGRREIRHRTAHKIRAAGNRVWLATPYFAPTRRMLRELGRAARRGTDVRLLLSGPETDQPIVRSAGSRHYGRLLRAGVRIYEYQDRCLHQKTCLCDDWLSAGSCNLDHWNMRWNRDANLETDCKKTVRAIATLFTDDFAASLEITANVYRKRSIWTRIRQKITSLMDVWLVRSTYRRQIRASRWLAAKSRRKNFN